MHGFGGTTNTLTQFPEKTVNLREIFIYGSDQSFHFRTMTPKPFTGTSNQRTHSDRAAK
jgi:hypothetical protein